MLDLIVHCLLFIFLKKGRGLPLVLLWILIHELFLSRCLQDSCTGLSVMRSPTLRLCCCAKHPGPKANREERKGLLPTPGHSPRGTVTSGIAAYWFTPCGFPYIIRPTCPGLVWPTMGGTHINLQTRKCPLPQGFLLRHLCQVDIIGF